MADLKQRSFEPELMDDFDLPASEIDPVLDGLGKMNSWFGGHREMIKAIQELKPTNGDHLADWGCGGGDMLIAIARWAKKLNINLKLTGIDAAEAAITFARRQSAVYGNISYLKADVLRTDIDTEQADIIICNLFSHHFNDEEWVQLVQNMWRGSRKGIVITDLHRHWLLYRAVQLIAWLSGNRMAGYDGPLSVKRSFKRRELETLLNKAGIKTYSLRWAWAFKWRIVIFKS